MRIADDDMKNIISSSVKRDDDDDSMFFLSLLMLQMSVRHSLFIRTHQLQTDLKKLICSHYDHHLL
jgi:hypothetical protein